MLHRLKAVASSYGLKPDWSAFGGLRSAKFWLGGGTLNGLGRQSAFRVAPLSANFVRPGHRACNTTEPNTAAAGLFPSLGRLAAAVSPWGIRNGRAKIEFGAVFRWVCFGDEPENLCSF
jgi:hypothetical protein